MHIRILGEDWFVFIFHIPLTFFGFIILAKVLLQFRENFYKKILTTTSNNIAIIWSSLSVKGKGIEVEGKRGGETQGEVLEIGVIWSGEKGM